MNIICRMLERLRRRSLMQRISQMAENTSLTYRVGWNKVTLTARHKFYSVHIGDVTIIVSRPCSILRTFSTLDFVFDGRPDSRFYASCNLRCFRGRKLVDEEEAILMLLKLSGRKIQELEKDEVARFESGLLTNRLSNLRSGQALLRRTTAGALLLLSKCRGGLKVKTTNNLEFVLGPRWMKVGDLAYTVFADSSQTRELLAFLLRGSNKITLISKDGSAQIIASKSDNRYDRFYDLLAESIIKDESPAVKMLLT